MRAVVSVLLGILVVTVLACSSDSAPEEDVPEFDKGEAVRLVKRRLTAGAGQYCGLISAVPLVIWEYERAKFGETYIGEGIWVVSTDIPGGGDAKPFPGAKWRVSENSKQVEILSAPEDC